MGQNVPYIEKEDDPGANLRVTFQWEKCSIDSAWCCSVLIETMLAYAIHNFEYQHIKITMMEARAFARVNNWKKWAISTYVKIIEIREVCPCIPCILNGIQVIRIDKDQGVHCIKIPWSLFEGYNSLGKTASLVALNGDALLWKLGFYIQYDMLNTNLLQKIMEQRASVMVTKWVYLQCQWNLSKYQWFHICE